MEKRCHTERLSSSTVALRTKMASGDTQMHFLCSDIHLDSPLCDRDLFKKHLDHTKENNGKVFIFGDLFDVMASFGDKRMAREEIDPQFIVRGRAYLDLVIEYATEFLMPYKDNLAFISLGNHEDVITRFHNTDILSRVVGNLNQAGGRVMQGSYKGWVFFQNLYEHSNGHQYVTRRLHYHHGFGGNAPRSKGVLAVQIEAMRYPDADIMVRGHTHQKWHDPSTVRERVTRFGKPYTEACEYIMLGSYKNGATESNGFETQRNFLPTKMGGWFMEHKLIKNSDIRVIETIYEAK